MQAPRCHHCRRRGEVCDLQWRVPGSQPQSSELTRPIDNTSIYDVGFLGYYADVVYPGVSLTPWGNWFWGIEVPRQAETAHYLARAITAISILHLTEAKSLDKERHALLAQGHFLDALAKFRSDISTINADNCVAAFTFSKLVVTFQMRISCLDEDVANKLGGVLGPDGALNAWKRTADFTRSLRPWLIHTPVVRLFHTKPGEATPDLGLFIDDALPHLTLLDQLTDHPTDRAATKLLREWFYMLQMQVREGAQLSWWPDSVSPEYVSRLGDSQPIPMIIFIYWCAAVHLSYQTWSVAGYPPQVALRMERQLGPDWGEVLECPLRVLRPREVEEIE